MLKIWGRTTSSNVQKVLWCCAELGIDYERVDLGGPFGGNRDPEYLAMNPNGRVPTISDDGLILWESNTICRYLAVTRQGERLYPSAPAARANVERWMDWQLATSGPPMASLLGMLVRARPEQRDQAAIEAARLQALSAWTIVEEDLADRSYLAGSELTLAEIALGTMVYRWHAFPIERPPLRNLKAWYERMRERPGFETYIEMSITVAAERRGVVDHPHRQRRAQAPHLHFAPRENIKRNAGRCPDDIRDYQLAIVFLGQVLQSRGDMDGLADCRRRCVLAIAGGANEAPPAMEADPDFERLLQFVGQGMFHLGDMPVDQPRRLEGLAAGLRGAGLGAENRHHPIADELVGHAAGRDDGAADCLEKTVEYEHDIKRQPVLDQLGRASDIDEQDRDEALGPAVGYIQKALIAHGRFRRQQRPDADIGHRLEVAGPADRAIGAKPGQHPRFDR